jgi:hypothetical protein
VPVNPPQADAERLEGENEKHHHSAPGLVTPDRVRYGEAEAINPPASKANSEA